MNQQKLPNATAVLILGISSILTCCCYGVLGLILGGVGLYLASQDQKLYNQNPEMYDNYSTLNTGKILSIIGIVLSCLYLVYIIVMIATVGVDALTDQDLMRERVQEALGQ